jgi:hypothetical protein
VFFLLNWMWNKEEHAIQLQLSEPVLNLVKGLAFIVPLAFLLSLLSSIITPTHFKFASRIGPPTQYASSTRTPPYKIYLK